MDGSKVLQFDILKAELFYPKRKENIVTDDLATNMARDMANCMLQELRDPTKTTSDYLTSEYSKFNWEYTIEEMYQVSVGKMVTKDPSESHFVQLTR